MRRTALPPLLLAAALVAGCGDDNLRKAAESQPPVGTLDGGGEADAGLPDDAAAPSDAGAADTGGPSEDAGGGDDAGGGQDAAVPPADTGPPPEPCPGPPPAPADVPASQSWSCSPAPSPECWACTPAADPAQEGQPCTVPGTAAQPGACEGGFCVSLVHGDPGDPGPHATTTLAHELEVDEGLFTSRIPLAIHRPEEPDRAPLVVFSHGFLLDGSQYASYAEHLASWGYAVILPDYPGGVVPRTHVRLKEDLALIVGWARSAALEVDGPFAGRADTTRVGLAGHSMGGKISLLLASEDPRPLAVFGIDPVDSDPPIVLEPEGYPSVTPERMPQIAVPLGLLGETENARADLGQACAPEEDNFHQYYAHATSPAIEIEVLGASHMSFLDDPGCGLVCDACPDGTDDPATTRRLTRRYLTAFFQVFLRGEDAYRAYLTGEPMTADVAAGLVRFETKNGF